MSATVQITLSPRARQLLAAAPAWPVAMMRNIAAALDRENELTTGYIQRNKLSRRAPQIGPKSTLGVVTNRLRSSARPSAAVITGDVIRSSIGSNVRYAGVHEFGYNGTVQVKAFTRRQVSNDIIKGAGRRGFTARQKREKLAASGIARVKAHSRQVHIPARAMFRSGIAERTANYSRAISRAVIATFAPPDNPAATT